jgi:Sec63 Brl domain
MGQAAEFHDIRLKSGEKSLYKHINRDVGIKFPVKVDIALPTHKVSLLLQAELGGMDFPVGEQFAKHTNQFQQDKAMVFQHVTRLVRCITDCQLTRGDSVSARHALELARSFAARVWDNSPLQLKQLDQIGNVTVRKLANAGINSIESLENTEAHRIEAVIGRGPPFGMTLLSKLAQFPKLRVSVKMAGKEMKPQRCIKIRLKADIGFLNETVPAFFRKKPIYVCFLAETSEGQIIDFRRMPASKLKNGHEILLTAELTKPSQFVLCHIMCDEIAGTCRFAEVRPNLPSSLFPASTEQREVIMTDETARKGPGSRKSQDVNGKRKPSEDFDDSGLEDGDLLAAEDVEIMDVDDFDEEMAALPAKKDRLHNKKTGNPKRQCLNDDSGDPAQLENGKWACNHKCKDKAKCKHLCCKEGLDKPPKPPKKASSSTTGDYPSIASILDIVNKDSPQHGHSNPNKSQVGLTKSFAHGSAGKQSPSSTRAKGMESLVKLHKATTPSIPTHGVLTALPNPKVRDRHKEPSFTDGMAASAKSLDEDPFDLNWDDDISPEDLEPLTNSNESVSMKHGIGDPVDVNEDVANHDLWSDLDNNDFTLDDNGASLLEASMIGLDDSIQLKQDATTRQTQKDDSGSKASFSSGTVRDSCSSMGKRLQLDDVFDDNDAFDDFGQEDLDICDLIPSRSSGAGPREDVPPLLSNDEPQTSPSKKLFFTSPEHARTAPTDASAEKGGLQRRQMADPPTQPINSSARLNEISITGVLNRGSDESQEQVQGGDSDEEDRAFPTKKREEVQTVAMDGIDPSFFDEFKDYVDFI